MLTNSTKKTVDLPEFTFENVRAIQNIAILLKETYPDSHTGQLPTIEDIMKLLANFKLLEALVEKYRKHLETENKLPGLIEYFENNFFEKGQNRRNMKKQMEAPLAIIDSVLKNQGIRRLLCNRLENVNFDNSLKNGKVLLFCLRKGELSNSSYSNYKALGNIIFNLYSSAATIDNNLAKNRTPNFLYFDDFTPYMTETALEQITDFSKQNIGVTITGETLENLTKDVTQVNLLNAFSSKFIFGDSSFDEMQIWANHFGTKKDWVGVKQNDDDSSLKKMLAYDDSGKWDNVPLIKAGKLMGGKKGAPAYRLRKEKGGYEVGTVKLSEITDEFYNGFKSKIYNFETADANLEQDITLNSSNGIFTSINKKNNSKKANISGPIRYN